MLKIKNTKIANVRVSLYGGNQFGFGNSVRKEKEGKRDRERDEMWVNSVWSDSIAIGSCGTRS